MSADYRLWLVPGEAVGDASGERMAELAENNMRGRALAAHDTTRGQVRAFDGHWAYERASARPGLCSTTALVLQAGYAAERADRWRHRSQFHVELADIGAYVAPGVATVG